MAKSYSDLLDSSNFNWPKGKGETFGRNRDVHSNIELTADPSRRLSLMVSGYKEAADSLIAGLTSPWQQNTQVYPILYLYRHFLELSLKEIVLWFGSDVQVDPDWRSHSLVKQWQKVRKIMEEFGVQGDTNADKKVNSVIEQFNGVDQDSKAFRYSTQSSGEPMELRVKDIDVVRLSRDMDELYNYFQGTVGYLDSLQSASEL
ncbi:hypothetical protein [Phaeobacter inhibens]|uniref:hypothetical protein n=1 Tax=Phaeobacter inhibens TaxID=221822 RepID=UPI00076BBA52|nr:hypothetical protein [Phaeobacter inhibens]KXF90324.1 hypothetical protein AT574_12175 [Phaeobacter inhibens]WHP68069.1 hypothetical protein QMZ01_16330 [Phaeobacter inhibens]